MAYELVDDFQYMNDQKQILKLPKGTKLENEIDGFFVLKIRNKSLKLEKEIVLKNPEFFKKIDWVVELADLLKKNKKATAPKLAKMVAEHVEQNVMKGSTLVSEELLHSMLEACRIQFFSVKDEKFLEPITKLGWSYNADGVYPPNA